MTRRSASAAALTRRRLVLLAASAVGSVLSRHAAAAAPGDQGIGGTGFSLRPADEEGDRGIGGTGVIGTIRKFGSIVVNDLRIAYPRDAAVEIDGRLASAADLKIGQVVRVVAARDASGGLSTRSIVVASEVVGPVEKVSRGGLVVLGQSVSTAELRGGKRWSEGDHVAVSGLRRPDGTVVASLIEPRAGSLTKVAGPLVQAADGALRIGGLRLTGASGALVGRRTIVEGEARGGVLAVRRSADEAALFPRSVQTVSVEAYVERRGETVRLGSGLSVAPTAVTDLPAGRPVRAVLTGTVDADGRLAVDEIRAGSTRYQTTPISRGKGGRVPMDFGRPGGTNAPERGGAREPGGFERPNNGADPGRLAPRGGGFGGGGLGGGGLGGGPGRR